MSAGNGTRVNAPQAFVSSYAPRLRTYGNSLLTPVQPQLAVPSVRTTKRGTTAINYAEEFDDDSIEDSDAPRRATGLRTAQQRRDVEINTDKGAQKELGKEIFEPVDVQGIWRDWMGKPKRALTERQMNVQATLPTALVPIRIDLDITPFRPEAALPTPNNAKDFGIDESLPAYRAPETTPQYRLKDSFLWNLHEALITPDQFAKTFVDEMDFPVMRKQAMVLEIGNSIRQQLEEHAAAALHPLFQPELVNRPTTNTNLPTPLPQQPPSREDTSTPMQKEAANGDLLQPPQPNGFHHDSGPSTPQLNEASTPSLAVSVQPLVRDQYTAPEHNPLDSHRCVLSISVDLQNRLYSDKFEWSLLHPPGFAEIFAKRTCADLGLSGEWMPSIAHAIYEASLRLKKEMIENGGILAGVVGSGINAWGNVENEAAEIHGSTGETAWEVGAGWRLDEDGLGQAWEPKIEVLSKEEIEKREGDRERQLRRARRETARFTTSYALQAQSSGLGDFFSGGLGSSRQANGGDEDERMGRGERSKKKRRIRSLSPAGRDTPEVLGFGGTSGQLTEGERQYWRCSHCVVWGSAIWGVRDGPAGPRVSLACAIARQSITDIPSRPSATTAAISTNATSASLPGTTTSSTSRNLKQQTLATPQTTPTPPLPTPTAPPPSPATPTSLSSPPALPHPRTAPPSPTTPTTPTAPTTTSTPPPTSTPAPPPPILAKSPLPPWPTSSTTPSPAKTWIGRLSSSHARGSDCRTLSMAGSIGNGG